MRNNSNVHQHAHWALVAFCGISNNPLANALEDEIDASIIHEQPLHHDAIDTRRQRRSIDVNLLKPAVDSYPETRLEQHEYSA